MLPTANRANTSLAAPLTARRHEVALIAGSRCQAFAPKGANLGPALFTAGAKPSHRPRVTTLLRRRIDLLLERFQTVFDRRAARERREFVLKRLAALLIG